MRIARERIAHDGNLAPLGDRIARLLSAVAQSLDQPWQNRPVARNAIKQVIALHEHLAHLATIRPVVSKFAASPRMDPNVLNDLRDSATQVIEIGKPIVADFERVLGDSHPDTLKSRNNLALAYEAAGRPARRSRCMNVSGLIVSESWAEPTRHAELP